MVLPLRAFVLIVLLAVCSNAAKAASVQEQASVISTSGDAAFPSPAAASEGSGIDCKFETSDKSASAQQFFLVSGCPAFPYKHADRGQPFKAGQDGVAVYVDHVASQRVPSSVMPVVQIFDDHMPVVSAVFSDSETVNGSVWVAFAKLDPGSRKPQVIVTRNQGGGAICCFQTTIFSQVGSKWERIEAPYQYADLHYRIMDVGADGYFELVGLDSEQIARTGQGGEISVSVRTYALRGSVLSDMR